MKKGDITRTRILDAAEQLFLEKGYEGTSVQDILDVVGMSKGGFYHYFEAKEGVLQAVSERRTQARIGRLSAELRDSRRAPLERLNLLLRQACLFETEEPHFAAMLLKLCYIDRAPAMWTRRRRILIELLEPLMENVLSAGLADGSFFMRRPAETGRMLLLLAFDVDEEVCAMLSGAPEDADRLIPALELMNACRDAAELLIGAQHGSLAIGDMTRWIARCREAMAELEV